jgi:hypothetical protein
MTRFAGGHPEYFGKLNHTVIRGQANLISTLFQEQNNHRVQGAGAKSSSASTDSTLHPNVVK